MKNKKNLYFLVPAVLFIWGFIIFRIVDFTSDGDNNFSPQTYTTPLREDQETEQYQLKTWYPDPFLKEVARKQQDFEVEDELVRDQPQMQETLAAEQPWNIIYRGYINESGTAERIALLVIDGKEVFLKSGAVHQTFTIAQILADSLSINSEDETRWVKKE